MVPKKFSRFAFTLLLVASSGEKNVYQPGQSSTESAIFALSLFSPGCYTGDIYSVLFGGRCRWPSQAVVGVSLLISNRGHGTQKFLAKPRYATFLKNVARRWHCVGDFGQEKCPQREIDSINYCHKFYFTYLLKRKFLAKPRYATFPKLRLELQAVMGRVGCMLAPQAHGTLLFSRRQGANA